MPLTVWKNNMRYHNWPPGVSTCSLGKTHPYGHRFPYPVVFPVCDCGVPLSAWGHQWLLWRFCLSLCSLSPPPIPYPSCLICIAPQSTVEMPACTNDSRSVCVCVRMCVYYIARAFYSVVGMIKSTAACWSGPYVNAFSHGAEWYPYLWSCTKPTLLHSNGWSMLYVCWFCRLFSFTSRMPSITCLLSLKCRLIFICVGSWGKDCSLRICRPWEGASLLATALINSLERVGLPSTALIHYSH